MAHSLFACGRAEAASLVRVCGRGKAARMTFCNCFDRLVIGRIRCTASLAQRQGLALGKAGKGSAMFGVDTLSLA